MTSTRPAADVDFELKSATGPARVESRSGWIDAALPHLADQAAAAAAKCGYSLRSGAVVSDAEGGAMPPSAWLSLRPSSAVSTKTSHTALAAAVGGAIVRGDAPPGTILPGEVRLAEVHGVSRSVVREAMRILVAKGLIRSTPGTGTRVSPRSDWHLLDREIMRWMLSRAQRPGLIRDLFQLRMIVEPPAVEFAAVGRTAAQVARLGYALEAMECRLVGAANITDARLLFHRTVMEATRNELLSSLHEVFAATISIHGAEKSLSNTFGPTSIASYRELFAGIADRDPSSARDAAAAIIQCEWHGVRT